MVAQPQISQATATGLKLALNEQLACWQHQYTLLYLVLRWTTFAPQTGHLILGRSSR